MNKVDIKTMLANANNPPIDMGMGGCESFITFNQMVLSRKTVAELCRLALKGLEAERAARPTRR